MHGLEEFGSAKDMPPSNGPWWKLLNRYHWFVLMVAALGWLFDCLDQQLFILARPAAVEDLVPGTPNTTPDELKLQRKRAGDIATSVFIAGWACGGLFFGMLGDRIGRAKTMLITILLYSLFTGLSSLSLGVADFAFYRFLTGLGVGGEFAVGVALVAEVMPAAARTNALALLQALSAFGNITAALINLRLGLAAEEGLEWSPWRIMFLIGALPALLALLIRSQLKEPEQWQKASHDGAMAKQLGSYTELFRHPTWRKHALLGLLLGCSGVIGLWSVGFYTPDLIRSVQAPVVEREVLAAVAAEGDAEAVERVRAAMKDPKLAAALSESDVAVKKTIDLRIKGRLTRWQSYTSIMINIGAFFGMYGFGLLSQRIGRKPTFAISLILAFLSTVSVFWFLRELWQIFVLVPIMGFCQLSLFGGYAVYFPELFPTRLRSTGTSFCYNVGRFLAALGPLVKTLLDQMYTGPEASRYTGITMCGVFLIGLFVLPFLPETRGKPLPE
jgi:MFS family permease